MCKKTILFENNCNIIIIDGENNIIYNILLNTSEKYV